VSVVASTEPRPGASGVAARGGNRPVGAEQAPLRILWVKVGGLWPLNTGGRLRTFHLIRELSAGNEVTVLTTHGPDEDPQELARQLPRCRAVRSVPFRPIKKDSARFLVTLLRSWLTRWPVDVCRNHVKALREAVERNLVDRDYDLVVSDFLVAAPNVPFDGDTPVLFFSHNVEYMIWRRLEENEQRWLHRRLLSVEWRKMRRYEHAVCRRAAYTVAVSEPDRDQLGAGADPARIGVISTGVDLDYFRPGDPEKETDRSLVFCGSMDWQPNEDAMLYFMAEILPRLREAVSDLSVTVVGRNPSARLRAMADRADVRVTGTVPDVRPFVQEAAVYIVPLRIGGGTRLKIYEALAMGKAVVSTTIGAEGLPLREGEHILRADAPADFARQVQALLEEPARRRAMGEAGRALMENRYGWPRVAETFAEHCWKVVTRAAPVDESPSQSQENMS